MGAVARKERALDGVPWCRGALATKLMESGSANEAEERGGAPSPCGRWAVVPAADPSWPRLPVRGAAVPQGTGARCCSRASAGETRAVFTLLWGRKSPGSQGGRVLPARGYGKTCVCGGMSSLLYSPNRCVKRILSVARAVETVPREGPKSIWLCLDLINHHTPRYQSSGNRWIYAAGVSPRSPLQGLSPGEGRGPWPMPHPAGSRALPWVLLAPVPGALRGARPAAPGLLSPWKLRVLPRCERSPVLPSGHCWARVGRAMAGAAGSCPARGICPPGSAPPPGAFRQFWDVQSGPTVPDAGALPSPHARPFASWLPQLRAGTGTVLRSRRLLKACGAAAGALLVAAPRLLALLLLKYHFLLLKSNSRTAVPAALAARHKSRPVRGAEVGLRCGGC